MADTGTSYISYISTCVQGLRVHVHLNRRLSPSSPSSRSLDLSLASPLVSSSAENYSENVSVNMTDVTDSAVSKAAKPSKSIEETYQKLSQL